MLINSGSFGSRFYICQLSAFGCDFNRSMQHLISNDREEDAGNEAKSIKVTERVLFNHFNELDNF